MSRIFSPINRLTYWIWMIVSFMVPWVGFWAMNHGANAWLLVAAIGASCVFQIFLMIKRSRDCGWAWWWPLVVWAMMFVSATADAVFPGRGLNSISGLILMGYVIFLGVSRPKREGQATEPFFGKRRA